MIKLHVRGMTCGHCEQTVSRALSSVAGVERVVTVDRVRAEAVVEGTAQLEALVAAVTKEGFEVEAVR